MTNLTREEAKAALTEHVNNLIAKELTNKLSAQIDQLFSSGALPLDEWDGADLKMPRCVTAALLDEAADRVIFRNDCKKYRKEISNLRTFL